MAQGCLKCLKYTMCAANFLFFLSGVTLLILVVYLIVNFKIATLSVTMANLNAPNILLVSGLIITCVSFLGFLGALKENRCLLLTFFLILFLLMLMELVAACLLLMYEREITGMVAEDLNKGLTKARENLGNSTTDLKDLNLIQEHFKCCGINNMSDWEDKIPSSCCQSDCNSAPKYWEEGCLKKLGDFFEENFLNIGIVVIFICVIEVLGMCFAMTLYCHISRSGLGYKL